MEPSKPIPAHPQGHQGIALLVIDVQQELFKKRVPIFMADQLLERINQLVERAHLAGVPVVYIQHSAVRFLEFGSPGWQLHPSLQEGTDDLHVFKEQGNAFEGTGLDELLRQHKVKIVVITGLVTQGCVKATCQGALALGYDVILAADAHSSYSKQAGELIDKCNKQLGELGVTILQTDQIKFLA